MALKIVESCVNCWACVDVCPSDAISEGGSHFKISASKCTECDGGYEEKQCASICPVEGAILLADGTPANPPGSLTGIPPERLAEAMREIQAR
ncbi:4Fe-4S dicluster domain-containing protein [Azotobacter beijerinckii]|uniref:4Fe-4S dicluster domain-containing protein n=1 Tax=Azotobacter beijerinckii TaxID=170623 RepID=A0A1H9HEK5_9GAMM|nr:4Fe-4S binding protein [Azotobacter beijerinckii]SEQ60702.1 4Fe-4S dicluster domain-containing protein [Azotobacter beijerinckii]